ncbi:hypothetical protein SAMN05428960_0352 [Mitsuaria sp. PDC51]|uniref:hypothetical protein n=1 Tax=Mitsuaria sp. PDC51 TaxID=1881035 RepID=UPI0008E352E3|nr:hypothetical protein [Mitsuaria sp. PDC51]SFR71229.1 hypothetical protein SAMN05428960_0352 [Mitsuaria sp. PDC51]
MRKLARLLALVVAASLPMQSFAAYECNVNLQHVLVYGNGAVNVLHSGRGDYTVVLPTYGEAPVPRYIGEIPTP